MGKTWANRQLRPFATESLVGDRVFALKRKKHGILCFFDRGYRVVCLTDACQAETPERHAAALACFQGYCEQINVAIFEAEMLGPTGGGS